MNEPTPGIRIGHAERAAAIAALDEHLAAGRLDADEYGDRVAHVSLARVRSEIDAQFTDLPSAHAPRPERRTRRVPAFPVLAFPVLAFLPFVLLALAIGAGAWWVIFFVPGILGCAGRGARGHPYRRAYRG